jgi:putative transcriptional regulator
MWRIGYLALIAIPVAFITTLAFGAAAQGAEPTMTFLVARPEMPDPMFAQTVILMLPRETAGRDFPLVVGLIVNKPIREVTLHKLFPSSSALKQRSDPAFFGGPVDVETPAIVFRANKPIDKAVHLAGDIYVNLDSDQAAALAQNPKQVQDFRLILGRSQWSPDQLHSEMMEGAWYTVNAAADIVFSDKPATLWNTLAARARLIPASASSRPPLAPGFVPIHSAMSGAVDYLRQRLLFAMP